MLGILTSAWRVIAGMGLSKHVGKAVVSGATYVKDRWRLFLKYWYYIVIVTLAMGWWIDHYRAGQTLEQCEIHLESARGILAAVTPTLRSNEAAMQQCLNTNKANIMAYLDLQESYETASDRVKELEQVSEAEIEDIRNESTQFRGQDVECRRLDDPLPQWFDLWLRERPGDKD